MPLSQYSDQALLNALLGKSTFTAPANYFIGVSSTFPNYDGSTITAPTDTAYARVSTVSSDWNAANLGWPSFSLNANTITFAQALANWCNGNPITYITVHDALTNGNFLGFGAANPPFTVSASQVLSFALNTIIWQLQ